MLLHGYWRSTASYRVRLALALKHLPFQQVAHDLRSGEHRDASYQAINPQKMVPALETAGDVFIQSAAIIEWLEEVHPTPPLLPRDHASRATVRAMAGIVACDIHPLNNLRVLNALRRDLNADDAQVSAWVGAWIFQGFEALERLIEIHGDGFAFGNEASMADCFLVPQVYSARRFGVPLDRFARITAACDAALALPEVAAAHPDAQPDAGRPG